MASQDGPIHTQSGIGFMRLYRRYRAPPEVFFEETWRLEMSIRAYGKLGAADPSAGQQLQCVL